ncbi:MAG: hypothetical protein B6226_02600 [Candidatus Cloacimonetes bacterium 4572_65]|nr:MAG: hypothetical protein B6226_02600 [Candidatus Cloacimonetes bacterium 4572_65]
MSKAIALIVCLIVLAGCSSYQLDTKLSAKNDEDVTKKMFYVELNSSRIERFKIRTSPKYENIIKHNRELLGEGNSYCIDENINKWNKLTPEIEELIIAKYGDRANTQQDALEYMSLILALITDNCSTFKIHIVEGDKVNEVFPGGYILIARKEIENCRTERELVYKIAIKVRQSLDIDTLLLSNLSQEVELEEAIEQSRNELLQLYSSSAFHGTDVTLSRDVASMMARNGFEPLYYRFEEDLIFVKPRSRHKKVLD